MKKQQQTHLIQSQDGEIHLTLEFCEYDDCFTNLELAKYAPSKVVKKAAGKALKSQCQTENKGKKPKLETH